MHCSAPICSDLSHLFSDCNSVYSVTDFSKQGKMEQVTAGCSSKMVVKIVSSYYRYFIAPSGTYFQSPFYHTRQQFSTEKTPCIAERLSHSLLSHHPEHLLSNRLFACGLVQFRSRSVQFFHTNHLVFGILQP